MTTEASLPRHLLVALDGSQLAEASLPLVETLATALGARITLLHVLEHEPPARIHGEPHLTTAANADAYLNQLAGRLRSAGLAVTADVHADPEPDVAASIAAHTAELDADLIVISAHGHGGLRGFLAGRIPEQVAARAGRPVLIAPAPPQRDPAVVRRILLPVDPAGEAAAALSLVRGLAEACRAEVVLVTIVPTPGTMPGDAAAATVFLPSTAARLLDLSEDQARAALSQLAGTLANSGLTVTPDVRRGDPARELVQAIAVHAPDLVVMATHAHPGLQGLWAGSVTPRVFAGVHCPLLLVPIRE